MSDSEESYGLPPYKVANTGTFGKPHWFDRVELEYTACRETVGLSDYSSFTKMDLWVRSHLSMILKINKRLFETKILPLFRNIES